MEFKDFKNDVPYHWDTIEEAMLEEDFDETTLHEFNVDPCREVLGQSFVSIVSEDNANRAISFIAQSASSTTIYWKCIYNDFTRESTYK